MFDVLKAAPLARLGYHQYSAVNNVFDMQMPFMEDDHVSGGVLGGEMRSNEEVAAEKAELEKRNLSAFRTEGV